PATGPRPCRDGDTRRTRRRRGRRTSGGGYGIALAARTPPVDPRSLIQRQPEGTGQRRHRSGPRPCPVGTATARTGPRPARPGTSRARTHRTRIMTPPIILASTSRYRGELLRRLLSAFEQRAPEAD